MSDMAYNISLYSPDKLHQVVEVLQYLWGDDFSRNLEYFRWKYDENPYAKAPLGVTASSNSRIVGFRGYFATKWHLPGSSREIIVLNPGDTVVHPDHRMQGLSVKMGRLAMDEYASEYNLFFNHSASAESIPGYLKMGFFPLLPKSVLSQYKLTGLAKFLYMSFVKKEADYRRIGMNEFGNISVSDAPHPEAMTSLISSQVTDSGKIALLQDKTFFNWRYSNKRNRYLFFYYQKNGRTFAYLVTRLAAKSRRGYICDYAADSIHYIEDILKCIIDKNFFDVLSIYNLNLSPEITDILSKTGFRDKGILRRLEKKIIGEWPLMIRPVRKDLSERDWLIDGIDVRQTGNWDIKEICSDSS